MRKHAPLLILSALISSALWLGLVHENAAAATTTTGTTGKTGKTGKSSKTAQKVVSDKGAKLDLQKAPFGKTPDGKEATVFTLTNKQGMKARITDYGATLVSLEVPDRKGQMADVVLGYDTMDGYVQDTSYFGCTVGRYANRIAKGKFSLDGVEYTLATNNDANHLHGGKVGFNKVLWTATPVEEPGARGLQFTYRSKDGEEGYPGNLDVSVIYLLTDQNELKLTYEANTDKPTVVNLTHHSYFNLAGQGAGDILSHELALSAKQFTAVDAGLIPTGELKDVAGTPLDFTASTAIGSRIAQVEGGYDHNFALTKAAAGQLELAAKVVEPVSGRVMEVLTTEPGIQFYTGNFLDGSIVGKAGKAYQKNFGLCLEAQHYPDSPNRPEFPTTVLRPGETYKQVTIYRFSAPQ